MRTQLILTVVWLSIGFAVSTSAQQTRSIPEQRTVLRAENYYRTELYMGRSIPNGGMVTDDAWERFLNEIVTPLFPDGFTLLAGRGQYREASGVIAREPSHVLVFFYRKADRKSASASIEKIRNEYKKQFAQESVLRVDIRKSLSVSF